MIAVAKGLLGGLATVAGSASKKDGETAPFAETFQQIAAAREAQAAASQRVASGGRKGEDPSALQSGKQAATAGSQEAPSLVAMAENDGQDSQFGGSTHQQAESGEGTNGLVPQPSQHLLDGSGSSEVRDEISVARGRASDASISSEGMRGPAVEPLDDSSAVLPTSVANSSTSPAVANGTTPGKDRVKEQGADPGVSQAVSTATASVHMTYARSEPGEGVPVPTATTPVPKSSSITSIAGASHRAAGKKNTAGSDVADATAGAPALPAIPDAQTISSMAVATGPVVPHASDNARNGEVTQSVTAVVTGPVLGVRALATGKQDLAPKPLAQAQATQADADSAKPVSDPATAAIDTEQVTAGNESSLVPAGEPSGKSVQQRGAVSGSTPTAKERKLSHQNLLPRCGPVISGQRPRFLLSSPLSIRRYPPVAWRRPPFQRRPLQVRRFQPSPCSRRPRMLRLARHPRQLALRRLPLARLCRPHCLVRITGFRRWRIPPSRLLRRCSKLAFRVERKDG